MTNSIYSGLKMCAYDFEPKILETSKNYPRHKCSAKHKRAQGVKGAYLAAAHEKKMQPKSNDMSAIRCDISSQPIRRKQRSMGPLEGLNHLKTGRASHNRLKDAQTSDLEKIRGGSRHVAVG